MGKVDDNKKQKKHTLLRAAFQLFTEKGFSTAGYAKYHSVSIGQFFPVCHAQVFRNPVRSIT